MIGPTSEMNIIYNNRDVSMIHYENGSTEIYSKDGEISDTFSDLSMESSNRLIQIMNEVVGICKTAEIIKKFTEEDM